MSKHRFASRRVRSSLSHLQRAILETLDRRQMLCVDHSTDQLGAALGTIGSNLPLPPDEITILGAGAPSATVPALNSNPSASVKLFLDFDGAPAMSWGTYNATTTPAFSTDGSASFSSAEITAITNIYKRVAEAFSPFNINVTTVDPATYADNATLRAVVGGSGAWYGNAGGVAYVGGFSNGASNTVFVFSNMLSNVAKYVSDAISHESGHGFGLMHQSTYNGTTKTAEYNPGTSAKAPIMGSSYSANRSTWWIGKSSVNSSTTQDDQAVIAANGTIGYRGDDHVGVTSGATLLDLSGDSGTGSGIIERTNDADVFSFTSLSGPVSFTAMPTADGGMLDVKLSLLDASGTVLATSSTASLSETVAATVTSGTYYLKVESAGNAGDVGQFSIAGTLTSSPDYVAAPTGLTGSASNGDVSLTWNDTSNNETDFVIQRTADGSSDWATIGTNAAGDNTFADNTAQANAIWRYRVYATGSAQNSGFSSAVAVAVTPAAPTNLTFASVATTSITLNWDASDNATGYRIERSINGTTWASIGTTNSSTEEFTNSSLLAITRYYYRVKAISAVGDSTATEAVNTVTAPAAPTISGTVTASSITLSWTNVAGETGYKLEQSTDGTQWSTLAEPTVNVVSFVHSGLTNSQKFFYRVQSISATGASAASAVINRTTLPATPADFTAVANGTSTAALGWADIDGETGYKIERLNGTSWAAVGAVLAANDVSETLTNLSPGTVYKFRLKAVNAGGDSGPTATITTTTAPAAPTLTLATLSSASIKLSWPDILTETGYVVERSDDGTTFESVATPAANATSYTDTALEPDTAYTYRVRGANAAGAGLNSAAKPGRTVQIAPGGLEASPFSSTQINLTWDDADGETGYRIERQNGTTWITLAEVAANVVNYSAIKLAGGTSYTFRLSTKNAGGYSAASSPDTARTMPAAPIAPTSASLTSTSIRVSWTNSVGNAGYQLDRSENGTNFTQIATPATNAITFVDSDVQPNTLYYYRVRGINASGAGPNSAVISRRSLLPTPTGLSAVADSATQLTLSWNNQDAETGFRVERQSGTSWILVGNTVADTTSRVITGLLGGTSYVLRLSALSPAGPSVPATISALTRPAAVTALSATTLTGGIRLAWANLTGETGFTIQRSSDGSDWSELATVGANVLTYTNSGLTAGTYFYRVFATNAAGTGTASAAVSKTIA